MAHQSPMISIPKKTTEDVDWTTPIRNLIAQSYGESPDNYATECAALQRCRQDAVRGAGSDMTARDLLYKYFGQLEQLELRFAEIRVSFPWHDAFTNKLTTQTSIAFEKASVIFQIASTHSSIAASQSRSDPEGLKRAFHYFRTCAGMLTYINDNFLHAPSTDLSREVVKFLVGVIIAQATEVFFEKCVVEKKGNALLSRVAAQAAYMYTGLSDEVKEFMGKGIFDRNWVTVIQVKAKYFLSLSQYYRALADSTAGKHGDALVRLTVAETAAKEAQRTALSFGSIFVTQMSPNIPADAGTSMAEITKAHLALCTEKRTEAQRDNDLIYNAVLPPAETLPVIEKAVVATALPIQEVYSTPEVQKTIGPDLFIKLIPLSVHESASVYSEEKAKLVRGEVEKAEAAEGELRSALDALGVKDGLSRFKAMVETGPGAENELPSEVRRWKEDISLVEEREPVPGLMNELNRLKESVRSDLEGTGRDIEIESRDCEAMRVKYEHLWTQAPSASLTKNLRQDLKSHFTALEAASSSDQQVNALWESVRGDIGLLLSDQIEEVFRASTESGPGESLLDLDVSSDAKDDDERVKIGQFVEEIDERLSKLSKIARERNEVLKDLKEKIQSDDVSHLLLLNRRNSAVEPTLFAAELEKFRPYQQRLAATVHHQQVTLQETSTLWKGLKDIASRGPGARKWEEREKRKKDTVRRFSRARDGYMEVRDGIAKGLQFYNDLSELGGTLRRNVKAFVASRTSEREALAGQLETQKRLSAPTSPPPLAEKPRPPPQPSVPGLDSSFASMNLRGAHQWSTPASLPLPQRPYPTSTPSLPPPPSQPVQSRYPPGPPTDPYANLFNTQGLSPHFSTSSPAPTQQQQQQQQQPQRYTSPPPLPAAPQQAYVQQNPYSQPPPQQAYQPYHQQSTSSPFPPPPPPVSYQSQQYPSSPPPPPSQNPASHQYLYQGFPPPPQQGYGQPPPGSYPSYGR